MRYKFYIIKISNCGCDAAPRPADGATETLLPLRPDVLFLSLLKRVSKNCTSAWARGSGGANVLVWRQQGNSHYSFIEFPKPPHDKDRCRGVGRWGLSVERWHHLRSWLCSTSEFYLAEWKIWWLCLWFNGKTAVYFGYFMCFLMKTLSLVHLPIMLCSSDSNPVLWCWSCVAVVLDLLHLGFWEVLMHFSQHVCGFLVYFGVRWFCWGWTSCRLWSPDCRRDSGRRWEQVSCQRFLSVSKSKWRKCNVGVLN